MAGYVPDRGDIVWLSLDPQAGHEQKGWRPVLVISPREYNRKTGLAIVAPITNKKKGYPFEVALPAGLKTTGVVLADQTKSVDWSARRAELDCQAPEETVLDLVEKFLPLIDPDAVFGTTGE